MHLRSRTASVSSGALLAVSSLLCAVACSSSDPSQGDVSGGSASSGSMGGAGGTSGGSTYATGTSSGSGGTSGTTSVIIGGGSGGSTGEASCASETAEAKLQDVYLAFVFDVSGSMGAGDFDWHDRTLKWDPVVAATKAFFADPTASGISASLLFFPSAADKCLVETYADPVVPMTPLPSADFAAAIDLVTPAVNGGQWRGGTPTLPAVQATIDYLEPLEAAEPSAVHAIVLVTDGYPQTCEEDGNSIANVVTAVSAVADHIPTYVVGVQNPPIDGAPDTVTGLHQVAMAGGTNSAFIIETGNPEQSAAALTQVINSIRATSVSCSVDIPEAPDGQVFDPARVNVNVTSGGVLTPLGYDETCTAANAWRYDDAASPTAIVLCESTCTSVETDLMASLGVEFGCTTRPPK